MWLRNWGYEPVLCSVDTKQGLDTLEFILRDQMSVIVGPSGVGKSSLINALRGNRTVVRAAEDDNWFEPLTDFKQQVVCRAACWGDVNEK